jgi:glycerol-3-phosphate acyltransferase PlsY
LEGEYVNLLIALLAMVIGYLVGSISFAQLLPRKFAPQQSLEERSAAIPGSAGGAQPTVYGAYTASLVLGTKFGILISLLDMAKVALPTLAFRLYAPHEPYYLVASVTGLVGHNWPLYHRFRGGRGFTAILGGFLAVDPLGVPVTIVVGMLLGMVVLGNMYAAYALWLPLTILWIWLRTHDVAHIVWAVVLNLIFFAATIPEIQGFMRRQRDGTQGAHEKAHMDLHPMWRTMAQLTERLRLRRKG